MHMYLYATDVKEKKKQWRDELGGKSSEGAKLIRGTELKEKERERE